MGEPAWRRQYLTSLFADADAPGEGFARRWCWGISLYAKAGVFVIDVGRFLTQFEGEPMEPKIVASVGLQFRPFDWQLGQEHIYYDGPHCIYKLGPFWFAREWTWCTKCYGDDA
jgi:hypothetical protein